MSAKSKTAKKSGEKRHEQKLKEIKNPLKKKYLKNMKVTIKFES